MGTYVMFFNSQLYAHILTWCEINDWHILAENDIIIRDDTHWQHPAGGSAQELQNSS